MKFFKFMPALFAAMAMSLTACGGDDEPDNDLTDGSIDEPMTIEQTKEEISAVAEEFMSKFNPNDQKELVQFIDYLAANYGDRDIESDDEYYAPMRHIGRSAEIIDLVNDVPTGIYTPGNDGDWVKTGNSSDVVFRIPNDARYGNIDLTVKRSGGKNEFDVTVPEEGDFHLVIPAKVTAILTAGSTTMLTEEIEANLNLGNKTLTATEPLTAANLKVAATVNATNSQANVTSTFSVGGERLIQANGTISGSNLCDIEAIANAVEDEAFERLISGAKMTGNIMNRLFLSGNANINSQVIDAYDSYFEFGYDYCDYASAAEASLACDRAVTLLNRNISCNIAFTNGGATQAKLVMIKDGDFWESYDGQAGCYYPMASVEFADGTTYTDDYFEYGFENVLSRFDALLNAYKNLCR